MKFKIDIPSGANEIIHTLQKNEHTAYIVGGCVRDSILGRIPNDWDICTSATPNEMLEIFKDKRVIETGMQHGTITVIVNSEAYEVTTYRIDGDYSDNRRPDYVTFTFKLVEDLRRRDFTINAMAYNDVDGLIDPFHGLIDIVYGQIKCVGSAKHRFSEDALRILRAIRFATQLDFTISPGTDWEIHQQYKNLKNISIERIQSEFCKIASSDSFCVQLLLYEDVFSLFIPELKDMIDFPQNNPYHDYDVFEHTIHAVEHCESEDVITRLAVFFHDFGKPHSFQDEENGRRHFKGHGKVSANIVNDVMRRLRFDNETRQKVVELVYYHDATFEPTKKHVKRWLNKIGEEQFRRLLEVRKADMLGQKQYCDPKRFDVIDGIITILDDVLRDEECFSMKDLAINGNDVMDIMMLKEGKDVGYWLKEILNRVINGELNNNKEDLIRWMTGIVDGWIRF